MCSRLHDFAGVWRFPQRLSAGAVFGRIAIVLTGLCLAGSPGFAQTAAPGIGPAAIGSASPHVDVADVAALREYAQAVGIDQTGPLAASESAGAGSPPDDETHARVLQARSERSGVPAGHPDIGPQSGHPEFAALRAYAKELAGGQPETAAPAPFRVAEADNALDAMREWFGKPQQPAPPPGAAPSPGAAPHPTPRRAPPPMAKRDPSFVGAQRVGGNTCLYCHSGQAESFHKTMMGRIAKTQPAKLDCENCHGPASAHVQAVGCAPCHGEGGISKKPGIPSLVGQEPQYLVTAMKAYAGGQRRHDLMRLVLSGVNDSEMQGIARYYARQMPGRAQTPPIGDPAAGRAETALCANCHGERGVSVYPGWPSLAGQDAQYLADAIKGYKDGSRSKAIGCAGCHGDGGISKRPGMPSLAGQDPQYLQVAMKHYVSGERKHPLMKTMLTGVGEAELGTIAAFYGRQIPARAQTPGTGDAAAGKTAAQLCVGCHGDESGSVAAAFPSLAGQDAQYVAGAIKAYKDGSRNKIIACANCHGDHGISKKPGTPSLVGLSQPYLVAAMKSYVEGHRKHPVMKALLTGVNDAELTSIAQHYSRQTPAKADTPPVGDAAAGKVASAMCAGCHGPLGISPNPAWPSLAGQEARYLADALKEYKDGTRDNPMMKPMVAALTEKAMNDIASHYASLAPAPAAPTPAGAAPSSDPVLNRNSLVSGLDDRTINDIAGYFASLAPAPTARVPGGPAGKEPVVVRNGIVASLDERAVRNLASYYASLSPESPATARNAPAAPAPVRVAFHRAADGSSPGGIVSFRKDDPSRRVEENNAICLSCHERGGRNYWSGSTHETRNVACTECHTVMQAVSRKANLKTVNELETCATCHKDRRAQLFRSSHMPLREGKMVCSSCHNPHGSATESMLIESSINATCYKCHAEKRGPFLFEHTPVRENCANCHDPHGSVNDNMLKISRPRLCSECHTIDHGNAIAGGPKVVQGFGRSCQNCHSKVHGSNSPAGALLLR